MQKLVLKGKASLKGEVTIGGSKNAALPILAATLLTDHPCKIQNVPIKLRDISTMIKLLQSLGKKIDVHEKGVVHVAKGGPTNHVAAYELVSTMRGSFCVLGPLLAKLGKAKVSLPGGCVIGLRPVDLHIKGLKSLGVDIDVDQGYVLAKRGKIKSTNIYLGGMFGSSVLATANIMMAAVLGQGSVVIESAACEPEIEDLVDFLNAMGANIVGKGTPRLQIKGVKKLKGCDYSVIPDRIEAGTFMLAAAATRSDITLCHARLDHLMSLCDVLKEVGIDIKAKGKKVVVKTPKKLKPVSIATYPYPGFPTDLQAQYMALMATVPGVCVVTEKVFPDRFMHIAELNRMGAKIRREFSSAIIEGSKKLKAAPVMASDLRASAALVIAGLAAEGETHIKRIYHLQRGYEDLEVKLTKLGAQAFLENES